MARRRSAWSLGAIECVLLAGLGCTPLAAQTVELGPPPIAPGYSIPKQTQRRLATAPSAGAGWFETSSRELVRYFYASMLVGTRTEPMNWTGSVTGCNPGTTSQAYRDAVASRINWFRGMAGVPAGIVLDPALNSKSQDAALMMSANRQLSHNPPTSWACYTAAGAEAASRSNLCYWYGPFDDPGCVEAYMEDAGAKNSAVGHRRWLLNPQTDVMATGDVAETGTWPNRR